VNGLARGVAHGRFRCDFPVTRDAAKKTAALEAPPLYQER
jgi:hypothetical protein